MGAVVQDKSSTFHSGVASSWSIAFDSNNAAGNLIYVWAGSNGSPAGTSVPTDSRNTYTNIRATFDATNNQSHGTWYAQNIGAGANTVTLAAAWQGANTAMGVLENSGLATSSPVDGSVQVGAVDTTTNGANAAGDASGTLNTGNASDFLVCSIQNINEAEPGTLTFSAGTSYTARSPSGTHVGKMQTQQVSSAANYAAAFTGNADQRSIHHGVAFKDAVVSAGGTQFIAKRGLPTPNLRGPMAKAWMGRPRPQAAITATVASSTLSAPGDSTATFVGAAQDNSVLAAAGDATATFTGASKAAAVLSAAGDATAAFTGAAKAASVLSAAGDSTASFTGAALDRGVLNAPGDSSLSFVGRSDAAAVWNAAADASAAWIGSTGGNVLSASGDSSGIFVGAELAAAVLAAAGDSSALWSGTFTLPGGDELGARAPMRGRGKARKPPKQRRPIYRHPEEVERERRMLEEYLESLETKARPASEEPVRPGESQEAPTRRAEPVAPRLSDVMARLASAQQLELIARAERVAEEDRAKAQKEHKRRRAAATAVLMMSH